MCFHRDSLTLDKLSNVGMQTEISLLFFQRKLKEEKVMDTTLMYQREVFELQKTLQQALIRQKELVEQAYALKRKVALLGGDEKQLEMDI